MGNFSRSLNRRERRAQRAALFGAPDDMAGLEGALSDTERPEGARRVNASEIVVQHDSLATTPEIAQFLRVHTKTVERWRKRYGLPCLKIGGRIRYDLGDVTRWASARKEVG